MTTRQTLNSWPTYPAPHPVTAGNGFLSSSNGHLGRVGQQEPIVSRQLGRSNSSELADRPGRREGGLDTFGLVWTCNTGRGGGELTAATSLREDDVFNKHSVNLVSPPSEATPDDSCLPVCGGGGGLGHLALH